MRAWKIHLCWGLVAMVAAGTWGRWTAARREADDGGRLAPDSAAPEELPQARSDPPPTVNAPRASLPPSALRLLPDPFDLPVDKIRVRMKSSNVADAYQAVELIINLKDPALKRELLLECVRSSHPQVRQSALVGLVSVMGGDAVPVVQGILVSDPELFVRKWAAELLGGLPDRG